METKQVVSALNALAQGTRLSLFRTLRECGPEGLRAGVIAERLAVPSSSLSFHLQRLERAGLITQRRFRRQLIYSVDSMHELMAYLSQNCCGVPWAVPPSGLCHENGMRC
jgi:ArsR family transcriptional regulator